MRGVARKINPCLVTEESGVVTRKTDGEILVELGSTVVVAERAFSCLVAPEVGDRVLVALEASGRAYVLAILERPKNETSRETKNEPKTTLSVDGDLEIRAAAGACTITAQENIRIASPTSVNLTTNEISVNALRGTMVLEKLSFVGKWVSGELGKLKLMAESVDSVVTRVSQNVTRSYRTITELDQVKAQQIDYSAKEQIRMHAKNTIVTSDNLVKVDGDQIHFG